jgi:hypothetical protein
MNKRIFISHAHADASLADELARALEAAGFAPWIDQREIRPGDSFLERMNAGLGVASYVVVLLSSTSSSSRWVTKEWMVALADQATVVVPVLLDDTVPPPLLRDILHFRVDTREPDLGPIVNFFRSEVSEPSPVRPRASTSAQGLHSVSRRQLRLVALRCLDEAALESFCFDAQVETARLQGPTFHGKLVSLLHVLSSEGLLFSFAEWLEHERARCVQHALDTLRVEPSWTWHVNDRTP